MKIDRWSLWVPFMLCLLTMLACGEKTAPEAFEDSEAPEVSEMPEASETVKEDGLRGPIATGWFYMADDQDYQTIPAYWSEIDFKDMDVLNIGPLGVQADGTFSLYNSPQTGDLANRFQWVIETARSQNPDVKIFVSQWWGDGTGIWGDALSVLQNEADIDTYAQSVYTLFKSYESVAGGLDGWDIDYEDNNVSSNTQTLTAKVKAQLASLSETTGQPYYISVSPADTSYLQPAVDNIDLVNMQNYAGGAGYDPPDYQALGFAYDQLLYGICPETGCPTKTPEQAEAAYQQYGLAGIHVWRLNSGNYQEEGQVQKEIYDYLHPSASASKPMRKPDS